MLLWALFTVGYLLGVFVTLKVFVIKENVQGYNNTYQASVESDQTSWEIHNDLVQPNVGKHTKKTTLSPNPSGTIYA